MSKRVKMRHKLQTSSTYGSKESHAVVMLKARTAALNPDNGHGAADEFGGSDFDEPKKHEVGVRTDPSPASSTHEPTIPSNPQPATIQDTYPGLVDAMRDAVNESRLERLAEDIFLTMLEKRYEPTSALPYTRVEYEQVAHEAINAAKTFLETLDQTVINNGEPQ